MASNSLKGFTKFLAGILLIIITIWFILVNPGNLGWGRALLDVILGGILLLVILIGVGLVLLGMADSKN